MRTDMATYYIECQKCRDSLYVRIHSEIPCPEFPEKENLLSHLVEIVRVHTDKVHPGVSDDKIRSWAREVKEQMIAA